ncbi:guanine nucleotide-binding protein G(I)/G(S)/G(O) subunit gamma-11 isoform 2-T2 [Macrochelys suwanniensis]
MPAINIEDLSEKDKLIMEVEQLRKEVKLERQPGLILEVLSDPMWSTGSIRSFTYDVSKCSEDIKNYIEERSGEDPLVKGIPEDRNPFKEKGGCVIA